MILQYSKLCHVPRGPTCQTETTIKLLTSLILRVLRKNGHSCQKCSNICYSSRPKEQQIDPSKLNYDIGLESRYTLEVGE